MEPDKRYIVGIDLGTTNSAASYVDLRLDRGRRKIQVFKIPQLTGPGEVSRLPVLPSFLYIPGTYDISEDALAAPWATNASENASFPGAFARDHGAKVPARLVSSAKSWLCHSGVDRKARILPWGAGDEVYKVSPVQAAASFLEHIRITWDRYMAEEEEDRLEYQLAIITVPASFDQVARDLTAEAATMAGFRDFILLEEPLAAFYSWLATCGARWGDYVRPDDLILVCDVGGGTTDFTLIALSESEGSPRFERIAVGDHLILGGDNVDLALARRLEIRLGKRRESLSADRWKALCHQCREAKEAILDGLESSRKIVVTGAGGKLIADTVSAVLTREEVEETVVEGFFPIADRSETPEAKSRSGIAEFGLPYEREPAITRHLGIFLERHREDIRKFTGRESPAPDLLLFNGGSLKPAVVRKRIGEAIRHWFSETAPHAHVPRELENPHPDLAVAIGASYYGLVKIGEGVRVGSGSPRSYFLRIASKDEKGEHIDSGQAICLVERGLDEGSLVELGNRKFEVLANRPVSFDIYSSSFRSGDRSGDLVEIDDTMTRLPPLRTVVQFGKKAASQNVPVALEASYTETGTLAIWCRSLVSNHRWKLQFQLRDEPQPEEVAESEVFDEEIVEQVLRKTKVAFDPKTDAAELQSLAKNIADIVGRPREKWPLGLIRRMADRLMEIQNARSISPRHEGRWLNLTGFCLRPGFGESFDPQRVAKLWKIYKQGMRFPNHPMVRSEWWILWRRTAAGLKPGQQKQFSQDVSGILATPKSAKTRINPAERMEIWMALASMELLLVKEKIRWGRLLLSELSPKKASPRHFWALSRLGARTLFHGPDDRVVAPEEVSRWLGSLLETDWRDQGPVVSAISAMARRTGDRARDIPDNLRKMLVQWLDSREGLQAHRRYLNEIVPMDAREQSVVFGESIPAGIVLKS